MAYNQGYSPTGNTGTIGVGVGQQPTGSQLRRRYMPNAGPSVGGAYGPAPGSSSYSKTPGASTGSFGGVGTPPPSSSTPSYDFGNKGGGPYFPNGGGPPTTPWMPPGVNQGATRRPPMGGVQGRPGGGNMTTTPGNNNPTYGGFNPSQVTQQNGQWGTVGRGGIFQALGTNALQRWLAQQAATQPAQPPAPTQQPQQPGYVTPQQWADWTNSGLNNWFTTGEQAAGRPTDYNAFNQWFQNYGQQYDPTAWSRLYGSNPAYNVGSSGNGVYFTG